MKNNPVKAFVLGLIRLYQKTLSPDHGWYKQNHPYGYCRFYPSCSEYAHQAVSLHGVAKGSALSASRLLRCHPWSEPKVDPVPLPKTSH